MRNVFIIGMKDFKSYFSSFIAYAVIATFLTLCGFFFFSMISSFGMLSMQVAQQQYYEGPLNLTEMITTPLFMNMCIIMLFMLPMITMRSFAEEKKLGTIEILYTYPVSDFDIVMGKYVGVIGLFAVMVAPTALYPLLVTTVGGTLEMATYYTGMLGLVFVGLSFLALGLFISSLTENQIIAVAVSFGLLLVFWMIGWVASVVPKEIGEYLKEISIIEHFRNFALGVIDTKDIVFYVLFIFFFLFFTQRSIEARNWRG